MRDHQGVHPCMGAVDLVPIYPLGEEVGVEDCAEQARGDFPFLILYFSVIAYRIFLLPLKSFLFKPFNIELFNINNFIKLTWFTNLSIYL